jgi:hypothetical protein
MRRLALLMGALVMMATLAVSATALASPASKSGRGSALPHVQHNGAITMGSSWTFYYSSWHGTDNFCETLTFGSGHTFLGDNTSTGTWSGNVTLRFTGGLDFQAGDVYRGKLQKSGALAGDFVGSVTYRKTSFSPFDLDPGASC